MRKLNSLALSIRDGRGPSLSGLWVRTPDCAWASVVLDTREHVAETVLGAIEPPARLLVVRPGRETTGWVELLCAAVDAGFELEDDPAKYDAVMGQQPVQATRP